MLEQDGVIYHVPQIKRVTVQYSGGSKAQRQYFNLAIKKWNKTKAVHFTEVKTHGVVKVHFSKGFSKTDSQIGGITLLSANADTGVIVKDNITMYPKRVHELGGRKNAYITADVHELGHALGLKHDSNAKSVMHATTWVDRLYPITTANVNAVKFIYHE
ncbi:matrixin family metalloprotease [Periweissella cryptocerci]|uniref:matrixin family metalloprotease n=1 Tax=Periweissella cryptocerci TaxID=2506420 RepID=UPI00140547C1|nr:matrixin family metalloprotease [Periweissella cryptocerci]